MLDTLEHTHNLLDIYLDDTIVENMCHCLGDMELAEPKIPDLKQRC